MRLNISFTFQVQILADWVGLDVQEDKRKEKFPASRVFPTGKAVHRAELTSWKGTHFPRGMTLREIFPYFEIKLSFLNINSDYFVECKSFYFPFLIELYFHVILCATSLYLTILINNWKTLNKQRQKLITID